MESFTEWFDRETGQSAQELQLSAAFEIAVCRVEAAAQRSADPIACLSNRASTLSRATTKSMLNQLGYTPAQTRLVQRLLAGSSGGWPGLLRLYTRNRSLDETLRAYVRRQMRMFRKAAAPCESVHSILGDEEVA